MAPVWPGPASLPPLPIASLSPSLSPLPLPLPSPSLLPSPPPPTLPLSLLTLDAFHLNCFPHLSQEYGVAPVWRNSCVFNPCLLQKLRPQIWNLKKNIKENLKKSKKSVSYQKKGFFWYEGLLLVWQRPRPLGTLLCDAAHMIWRGSGVTYCPYEVNIFPCFCHF